MALSNATLIAGATITTTGGTTLNFAPSSQISLDGIELINTDEADFRIRKRITCRSKSPSYNSAANLWSKGKNFVTLIAPKILADLTVTFPTGRIELDYHPEMTAAERLEMRKLLAQSLLDTDFEKFWETGSKA